eukprot:TRINITY_DN643_c0_g2_i1.p1 TRINITY_DN643_c0_g2~~TRINITY_DN643_c0_g2_i1.p1  ORF type:complete len:618 (+),score=200.50 TRINITY_DN643_c0_g2_i1:127-1980(+)
MGRPFYLRHSLLFFLGFIVISGPALTSAQDATYLQLFASSIPNFPPYFWVALLTSPCPTGSWQGVVCDDSGNVTKVDLSYVNGGSQHVPKLNATLSWNITGVKQLQELNLANNLFYGSIPQELSLARNLNRLILNGNLFTGPIPDTLADIPNLTCLNLVNNSLTGTIPANLSHFPCVDFEGNNLTFTYNVSCQAGNLSSCAPKQLNDVAPSSGNGVSLGAVIGGVVGGLVLLGLLVAAGVFFKRWREKVQRRREEALLAEDIENQISTRHFGSLRRFNVEDLMKSTNGFDDDNIIGEGGYAKVYKGKLEDGSEVAIKRLKRKEKGGELLFLNEVELISRAVHKNLMRVEGFCVETGECMLVLPFMSNGSVATRTQGKEGNPMSWLQRQKVALGAAEGVAYLHNDCNPKIIHRDIKAANVLLNEEDEPVIADFGLAREMEADQTHQDATVKGTIGYIAPEYLETGQLSEKTDVYAFGVFLLELVSGLDLFALTELTGEEDIILVDWVQTLIKDGKVSYLVDRELKPEEYNVKEVEKMLQVALMCMAQDPANRPTMTEVTKMLSVRELAEKWGQWQAEASVSKDEEDLIGIAKQKPSADIWKNNTTAISLSDFELTSPR